MASNFECFSVGIEQTRALGAVIGRFLQAGDIVLLRGDLGTGKTCLTGGIAQGCENPLKSPVLSPYYTILNIYEGPLPIYHFDLYRLNAQVELYDLAYEEYLYGDGIAVIEWPEILMPLLGSDSFLLVDLMRIEENCRKFVLTDADDQFASLFEALKSLSVGSSGMEQKSK